MSDAKCIVCLKKSFYFDICQRAEKSAGNALLAFFFYNVVQVLIGAPI